jgi:glycosyltransferase involved in cell wall biosynthesis
MRVLIINQTFYPDVAATAQHCHDLGKHLVQQGHEVVVITSRSMYGQKGSVLAKRDAVDGIEVHRVGASLFGKSSIFLRLVDFLWFYLMASIKALRLRRADATITLTTPPFLCLVGIMLRWLRGSRCVYWVMDLYPDVAVAGGVLKHRGLIRRALEKLHRWCLRRVDQIVVLGRCMEQRILKKGAPPHRVTRIGVWSAQPPTKPNGHNRYRQQWQLNDAFVVMYAGNLGLAHDEQTLCEAARWLHDDPHIQFVFVGGGKRMQQVEQYVQQHQLTNVHIYDYQPREQLPELLSMPDVHIISQLNKFSGLVVPSKFYGILAAGRPVIFIGPEDAEIAQSLAENETGFRVPIGDVDGLARTLKQLQHAEEELGAMNDRAHNLARGRYSPQSRCEAWNDVLEGLGAPEPVGA